MRWSTGMRMKDEGNPGHRAPPAGPTAARQAPREPSREHSVGHPGDASGKLWVDPSCTGVRQWNTLKIPQENQKGNHPRMQHRDFCGAQEETQGHTAGARGGEGR